MAGTKSLDLTISGRVVGVGLRLWIKQLANRLGVTGWVRNNVDRTVSAHLEGPGEAVDSLLEQLRRPNLEAATVEDVQVRDAESHGYSEFAVEY